MRQTVMTLSAGMRPGPYEIFAPAGKGGMGHVWEAGDTRLERIVHREVAAKILSDSFATAPDRLTQLTRESQMLASLICAVGDGAIVLELEEAPMLEERIARGAIPIAEALGIASQIAEEVEAPLGLTDAMADDLAGADPANSPSRRLRPKASHWAASNLRSAPLRKLFFAVNPDLVRL